MHCSAPKSFPLPKAAHTGFSLEQEAWRFAGDEDHGPLALVQSRPRKQCQRSRGPTRTHITKTEAKGEFGFKAAFVFECSSVQTALIIEDLLQQRYHSYGLPRRLHQQCCRLCGGGEHRCWSSDGKSKEELGTSLTRETDARAKVYITFSVDLTQKISDGVVKVRR